MLTQIPVWQPMFSWDAFVVTPGFTELYIPENNAYPVVIMPIDAAGTAGQFDCRVRLEVHGKLNMNLFFSNVVTQAEF